MSELQNLLEQIEAAFGVRICVHDLSGITLISNDLQLPMEWKTHGCQYCTVAKDYTSVSACMQQKEIALYLLKRNQGKPYCGICRMGVSDYIQPVILDGKVLAVVFASGVIRAHRIEGRAKLEKQISLLPFDCSELLMAYEEYADLSATTEEQLRLFAEMTASYILQTARHSVVPMTGLKESRGSYPVEPVKLRTAGTVAVILEYLEKNYCCPLSLKALSMRFFLSEGHINRLVRAEVHMGAMAYVKRLRIQNAERLLKNSDQPLRSIAESCGFKELNYFCRVFKAECGISPAEYRKQFASYHQKAQTKH